MAKRLILIHGRNFKPPEASLRQGWLRALGRGIEHASGQPGRLAASGAGIDFVYYGEESNALLLSRGREYDAASDQADRESCLQALLGYATSDFEPDAARQIYKRIRGVNPLLEAVADIASGPLRLLGLADAIVGRVAPDMREYWNPDSEFGTSVRWKLTEPLRDALNDGDDVCLVSHSLGTLISFDTLWKLSHYGEYRHLADRGVSLWITLGSPLGDDTVRDRLKGAAARGARRYPKNVRRWLNVAAEDDYVSHDSRVADDYAGMRARGLIDSIRDAATYNFSIRHGRANPHHAAGYLVHPRVGGAVAEWLDG